MKLSRHAGQKRFGFTLIEILVVVAIIAILLAIILPAVFNIMKVGRQTVTFAEITQLDSAITDFKKTFNAAYIPSQIKICEQFGQYQITDNGSAADNPLDRDSVTYLTGLFPNILGNQSIWKSPGIDWNGDGKSTPPVILEGDQCLVFFLGGIRSPPGVAPSTIGFNNDPRDPSKPNDNNRKLPTMNFVPRQLFVRTSPVSPLTVPTSSGPGPTAAQMGYLSYADPYFTGSSVAGQDKPYLYFSSYGVNNGYNKYGPKGDCPSPYYVLTGNVPSPAPVAPYFSSPGNFYNSKSHQIISAGADQFFGQGGLAGPYSAATVGTFQGPAKDDLTNFNGSKLVGSGF